MVTSELPMRRKALIAGFAFPVGVVALVLVARNSGETEPPPEQQVIEATVARIAAESREALPEPVTQAIPKLSLTEVMPERPAIRPAAVAAGWIFVRGV